MGEGGLEMNFNNSSVALVQTVQEMTSDVWTREKVATLGEMALPLATKPISFHHLGNDPI